MVLYEETQNWEERVLQKEENNLIANLNLDGKEKQERKHRQQSQRNHLPLLQSSTIRELMWEWDSDSALNLPEFHPNLEPGHQTSAALCALAIPSLQNKPPCDIPHPAGKLCWGHNSWQSVLGWDRGPPVPSCWDTIKDSTRTRQGQPGNSSAEWKCPFLMETSEQGSQEERWDHRRSTHNKRKEGHMQIYF